MKAITVRLPDSLVAEIEAESRHRNLSKSDVVRERLSRAPRFPRKGPALLEAVADLIGSVDGLAADLSVVRKEHVKPSRYGAKRHPRHR